MSQDFKVICPAGGTVPGIDISHYNHPVQWSGQFAFIKASEGLSKDPRFDANWADAKAHGVYRGAYHYFREADDPNEQADFFVNTVGQGCELGYVLDWEEYPNAVEAARMFLAKVTALTGRRAIIYSYVDFLINLGINRPYFTGYPLWIAEPGVTCPKVPDGWATWLFWQYKFGVDPGPDLNLFNGSLDDLKAMIK